MGELNKIIRSKAPFRIGLAGGGTDLSPYSEDHGGAILNATINLFANTTIIPNNSGIIRIFNVTNGISEEFTSDLEINTNHELKLQAGTYNRIVKDFTKEALSFDLYTHMDVPSGSGLGTSSTLVVSVLGAFVEWLKLPLGEYDIAHLAWEIEREDLELKGGKQDQYSATFGGVNFMEFLSAGNVIVNPLRVKDEYLMELSHNLLLYFTETSRESSDIIDEQQKGFLGSNTSLLALHELKSQAFQMKESVLKNDLINVGEILHFGWTNKKNLAKGVSNVLIDELYDTALKNGAIGGKISGAGGGGFMVFYCPEVSKYKVINALEKIGGKPINYQFYSKGLETWSIN